MNEKELIKQLQNLPNEVEAKDQWAQIKQAIEANADESNLSASQTIDNKAVKRRWFYPVSIAASIFAVAFVVMLVPQDSSEVEFAFAQDKVLQSLQEANNQYYSALGDVLRNRASAMPNGLQITLKDLREAQASYRLELTENPNNTDLYRKLIKTYQTERELLKNLVS